MRIQLILPEALSEQLGLLLPSRSEPCSPYRLPSFPLPLPSEPGGQGSAGTGQLSGGEKTSHVGSLWSSRVLLDPSLPSPKFAYTFSPGSGLTVRHAQPIALC